MCGDKVYSVNYLAQAVAKAMGCEANIKYLDARHEVKHAFCDYSKAKEFFNVRKDVPLYEGLKRMAEWAKKIGSCMSKSFKNIETEKNMPPSWRINLSAEKV